MILDSNDPLLHALPEHVLEKIVVFVGHHHQKGWIVQCMSKDPDVSKVARFYKNVHPSRVKAIVSRHNSRIIRNFQKMNAND